MRPFFVCRYNFTHFSLFPAAGIPVWGRHRFHYLSFANLNRFICSCEECERKKNDTVPVFESRREKILSVVPINFVIRIKITTNNKDEILSHLLLLLSPPDDYYLWLFLNQSISHPSARSEVVCWTIIWCMGFRWLTMSRCVDWIKNMVCKRQRRRQIVERNLLNNHYVHHNHHPRTSTYD
jgi:hypothetical protein